MASPGPSAIQANSNSHLQGPTSRPDLTAESSYTPSSPSSNNTYLMPVSPPKTTLAGANRYRPKITRTTGQRPACLVNGSVTYCGDDQIIAFGGFDQYTDEVYNHVLKLDLRSLRWNLVDNYGDIPGVRMGHTATLYGGDKLLIYGGENEHRVYLSDVMMFDLKTAHWTQPAISGPVPKGRARHAAALHEDKLFIVGGVTGPSNSVLNDVCFLDLKTWTWSRTWSFIARFDHTAWVWGGRLWVFGGLGEDMERGGEISWLDLKGNPVFDTPGAPTPAELRGSPARLTGGGRSAFGSVHSAAIGGSGYAANSSSVQVSPTSFARLTSPPNAPGAVSALKFLSGPNLPSQASGNHFHIHSCGTLLDFVTPASTIRPADCGLSALDLDSLRWQNLTEGAEVFNAGYRWHYCAMNEDGTKAWLLGCATDSQTGPGGALEDDLCDVLAIDLKRFGLLGSERTRLEAGCDSMVDGYANAPLMGLGLDLASVFDVPPESGGGADFVVTAQAEEEGLTMSGHVVASGGDDSKEMRQTSANGTVSPAIHVHKLLLLARWPHFRRLWSAQMAEFHTKKMHIPEPYAVVRSFLLYLYTDSISSHPPNGVDLGQVAGLLVLANMYDMPRLRLLCLNRLGRELDVEHAAVIWERAGLAEEEWLRRRAASFCLTHWGRVVRTQAFRRLDRNSLMELCEEIDTEGRVVGGQELEAVGGLGGGRFGVGGIGDDLPKARTTHVGVPASDDVDYTEAEDEESMEMG